MNFIFLKSKKRMAAGFAGAAIAFALCLHYGGSVFKCAAVSALFVLASLVQIRVERKFRTGIIMLMLPVSAFAGLVLSQFVLGEGIASLSPAAVLLSTCCCLVVIGVVFLLIPNLTVATALGIGAIMQLATVNYFVYTFRGSELLFIDLFSVSTAANVVSQYDYTPSANMVYGWVLYVLYVFILSAVRLDRIPWRSADHFKPGILAAAAAVTLGLFSGQVSARYYGKDGTYSNGYILNFVLTISNSFVEVPEGYSSGQAEAIAQTYPSAPEAGETPHIIVIMDEAYADLSVLGSAVNTDTAISPFISSLEENTVKGYALSSAYGGRTANSEYEVLTGLTMGFLPDNVIAYQQYSDPGQYSMVSHLESLGYQTVAAHPFLADGWMRNTVWPGMGFDTCYFLEDFPRTDLLRGLVSDREMVDFIIASYENRRAQMPLFFYGVTMQNHSSYDYAGPDFEERVHLDGYTRDYPEAEQYLTLIRETDAAVEKLITYFSGTEEPVIVLFYGDHLPALSQNLYDEIHGGEFTSLDEKMQQYMVPFFIWANFDIEERTVPCTSLSYLSTYLYEAAGMALPGFNRFLKELEAKIPACNMLGYYSVSAGCFLPYDAASGSEKEWLRNYQILQYNAIFDTEERCSMFGVNEGESR